MEKINIEQSEIAIDLVDIEEVEKKYNIKLPPTYKTLLLTYNGGMCYDDRLICDLCSIRYGDVTLEETIYDLQICEPLIPRSYLPFAITGVGHIIALCINPKDDNYEKIFFIRHDEFELELIEDSLEDLFEVKHIDEL
jgi:hypothetical protein